MNRAFASLIAGMLFADGGLILSSREFVLMGGDSGPAAIAGKPTQSLLLKAVRKQGKGKMPRNADALSARSRRSSAATAPSPVGAVPVSVANGLIQPRRL